MIRGNILLIKAKARNINALPSFQFFFIKSFEGAIQPEKAVVQNAGEETGPG